MQRATPLCASNDPCRGELCDTRDDSGCAAPIFMSDRNPKSGAQNTRTSASYHIFWMGLIIWSATLLVFDAACTIDPISFKSGKSSELLPATMADAIRSKS